MATLAADMSFDFIFPSCEPVTPPSFSFDPSLFQMPYNPGHARSSSYGSFCSTTESSPSDSVSTRVTTPSRSPPPVRQHGPILLPKIRSQDQAIASPQPKRVKTSPTPAPKPRRQGSFRPTHTRSFTNPETLNHFTNFSFTPNEDQSSLSQSLLCSPITFAQDSPHSRRASTVSLDGSALEKYGFPTYRQMPTYVPAVTQPQAEQQFMYNFAPRAPSPLSLASTPDPTPSTTLMNYLTTSNPAPSLVRTISFPLRDPNTKHFWWDAHQPC
ncbi:putative sialidase-like protein [Eutypa lata UCREL1]|uniref:Putative sialidase-like protein n=1 Tax=Eutypa lata (strain UCR-EL1) TaxID=1287681 RepID=M7T2H8_EUTLA|nr:putative sialidase-like protein [Eutypa lata UCREL1]